MSFPDAFESSRLHHLDCSNLWCNTVAVFGLLSLRPFRESLSHVSNKAQFLLTGIICRTQQNKLIAIEKHKLAVKDFPVPAEYTWLPCRFALAHTSRLYLRACCAEIAPAWFTSFMLFRDIILLCRKRITFWLLFALYHINQDKINAKPVLYCHQNGI